MKKALFLIVLTVLSCKTVKQQDSIVYILPNNVIKTLEQRINGRYDKIYFRLSNNGDNYSIYYSYINNNSMISAWVKNTNRKILIDKKLYPLIFNLDESLGTTDSYSKILKEIKESTYYPSYSRVRILYHGEIIVFNLRGEIFSN